MDIQKESEFNETMNLVKAVLERLEFHAFEDVLIWSNEHASKALLRCLKKTLSEFENGHLVLTSSYPKLEHFSVDSVVRGLMTALDQAQERQDNLNREIDELEDQLAKAQAVPEQDQQVWATSNLTWKDVAFKALSCKVLKSTENWVHVKNIACVGSTTASLICKKLGVNPDGTKFELIEAQEQSYV